VALLFNPPSPPEEHRSKERMANGEKKDTSSYQVKWLHLDTMEQDLDK
jgi:hypothetical protein